MPAISSQNKNNPLTNPLTRGVNGGWAEWAIAHLGLGRIEGAAGQWWRAALLLTYPALGRNQRMKKYFP